MKGKLKGTAYTKEEFLYKKAHPIKWQIRQFFKNLFNGKAHNTHK